MATGDCNCTGSGNRGEHNVHELLCELFDPGTSPARAEQIRRDIAACPICRRQLESEQTVRSLVRDCCGQQRAPEPLRQRIITSITSVTYTEVRYR